MVERTAGGSVIGMIVNEDVSAECCHIMSSNVIASARTYLCKVVFICQGAILSRSINVF